MGVRAIQEADRRRDVHRYDRAVLGPALRQGEPLWAEMLEARQLLAALFETADVIGEGPYDGEVFMLLTVERGHFRRLVHFGSSTDGLEPDAEGGNDEDFESGGDDEPDPEWEPDVKNAESVYRTRYAVA